MIQFHPNLLEALSPQLKSPRLAVRKRSIIALGHLVMSCDQTLYLKLINMLLEELSKGQNAQNTRTYIQAIGNIILLIIIIIFCNFKIFVILNLGFW